MDIKDLIQKKQELIYDVKEKLEDFMEENKLGISEVHIEIVKLNPSNIYRVKNIDIKLDI